LLKLAQKNIVFANTPKDEYSNNNAKHLTTTNSNCAFKNMKLDELFLFIDHKQF